MKKIIDLVFGFWSDGLKSHNDEINYFFIKQEENIIIKKEEDDIFQQINLAGSLK